MLFESLVENLSKSSFIISDPCFVAITDLTVLVFPALAFGVLNSLDSGTFRFDSFQLSLQSSLILKNLLFIPIFLQQFNLHRLPSLFFIIYPPSRSLSLSHLSSHFCISSLFFSFHLFFFDYLLYRSSSVTPKIYLFSADLVIYLFNNKSICR